MAIMAVAWVAASIVVTILLARVFSWLRGPRPIEMHDEVASMDTLQMSITKPTSDSLR
jgi:hypothetical protein